MRCRSVNVMGHRERLVNGSGGCWHNQHILYRNLPASVFSAAEEIDGEARQREWLDTGDLRKSLP
jgi:hypothetical protein